MDKERSAKPSIVSVADSSSHSRNDYSSEYWPVSILCKSRCEKGVLGPTRPRLWKRLMLVVLHVIQEGMMLVEEVRIDIQRRQIECIATCSFGNSRSDRVPRVWGFFLSTVPVSRLASCLSTMHIHVDLRSQLVDIWLHTPQVCMILGCKPFAGSIPSSFSWNILEFQIHKRRKRHWLFSLETLSRSSSWQCSRPADECHIARKPTKRIVLNLFRQSVLFN